MMARTSDQLHKILETEAWIFDEGFAPSESKKCLEDPMRLKLESDGVVIGLPSDQVVLTGEGMVAAFQRHPKGNITALWCGNLILYLR